MAEYGTASQATHENLVWSMRFECWKIKDTDKHSEYEILIAFVLHQLLLRRT